ncbi:MAG TPA: thioredoxin domain-containing protein [Terriglobia bacterium]|nr:thioredoxin domain-containing protein [Terriglobia bacterium]
MRKILLLVLTLAGSFDALYLHWVYTSPNHPLVCIGGGCDVVRASKYASLWGHALPDYGVLMYGVLLIAVLLEAWITNPGGRRSLQLAVAAISIAGFAFSVYLTFLEGFVIHAWCAWCVGSAVIVTLIMLLSLANVRSSGLESEKGRFRIRKQFVIVVVVMAAIEVPVFRYLISRPEAPAPGAAVPAAVLDQRLVRTDSHATGDPSSPVTVVEFGDFECPGCGAIEPEVQDMLARYGNRIRFVFRQYPLRDMHPYAETAAEASECAGVQGKFWEAMRKFYAEQDDLTEPALDRYASELGLDTRQFDACLASGAVKARVQADVDDGRAVGVKGTPTFFVGHKMFFTAPFAEIVQSVNQQLASASRPGGPSASAPNASAGSGSDAFGSFGGNTSPTFAAQSELNCSTDELKKQQPALIHTAALQQLLKGPSKPVLVDVRTPAQFKNGHLPGAESVPVERIETHGGNLPKDKTLVLYEGGQGGASDACAVSRAGARMLFGQGYDFAKVKVYQDGLKGWEKAGLPVEK